MLPFGSENRGNLFLPFASYIQLGKNRFRKERDAGLDQENKSRGDGLGPPLIRVRDLWKEYPTGDEAVVVLKGLNLDIYRGELCCIFGTSGSGKSTLLNQLAGLEKPTRGEILIGGVPVTRLREEALATFRQQHVGFVFQSYNLLPFMTAEENVAMPLMFRGVKKEERLKAARQMLERVGLSDRCTHYPGQMSGGQQQRVGIARAFITRPDVVFADEPTGNLDSRTTIEVIEMIRDFARRYHQTIIMVTHDRDMASYADRIITLVDGTIVDDKRNTIQEERQEAKL